MQRHRITPRPDFADRASRLDFHYANVEDGSYWDESACWEFSEAEVNMLDSVTAELDRLCLAALDRAIREDRRETLGLSRALWRLVTQSWRRGDASLYGRMDLRWDGVSPPKLLEYNADTPTTLYEASVVQWEWLQTVRPGADQFNSLHEALIARWGDIGSAGGKATQRIHFACMRGWIEDKGTIDYLRDTAMQAGIDAPFIAIEDIGWDGARFRDMENDAMSCIFKLYPWDWLLHDPFGAHIGGSPTQWIEPAWRVALASKGILALLWEYFPDHPNLLPAYRDPGRVNGPAITKPLLGREGANISAPGMTTSGGYGEEGFVHQQWCPLPCVDGRYPVFGSWVIGGKPHGLGIREDPTPIPNDKSCFVPHFFRPGA
jgi:glutathionylspermidine synthase